MFKSERANWQNPRVLSVLILVFLAGGLSGAFVMRGIHRRMHRPPPAIALSDNRQLSYDQLKNELHLTPQQADQLKSILDDFVKYNQDLQAQVEDWRATGKERIRSILRPDQKQTFEKLCLEVQASQ